MLAELKKKQLKQQQKIETRLFPLVFTISQSVREGKMSITFFGNCQLQLQFKLQFKLQFNLQFEIQFKLQFKIQFKLQFEIQFKLK